MSKHDVEMRILVLKKMLLTASGAYAEMIQRNIDSYNKMLGNK